MQTCQPQLLDLKKKKKKKKGFEPNNKSIWNTYLITWFGCGGTTHVPCFEQKSSSGAHPSPGLQLVWIQSFFSYTSNHTKVK